jgi:hypothetical protein
MYGEKFHPEKQPSHTTELKNRKIQRSSDLLFEKQDGCGLGPANFRTGIGNRIRYFCSMPEQVLNPAIDQPALQNLLAAHGGCLLESQVVSLLGLKDASTVAEWRKYRQVVSVRTEAGDWVYPIWQFARKHRRVMLGIRDCLAELTYENEWEPIVFFLTKKKSLGDHSPLDRLRAGKIEAAILAARFCGQFTDA